MINSFGTIAFLIFIIKICLQELIDLLKGNTEIIPIITAIIALIGLLVTTLVKVWLDWQVNQTKIKSEVIAKSRVEWLELIRLNTAILIESYYTYMNNFTLTQGGHHNLLKDLSDAQAKYNKSYWLLKLYYTEKNQYGFPNDKHIEILNRLDKFNDEVESFIDSNHGRYGAFDPKELEPYLKDFVEVSSSYFKDVWEEAKKNK